MSRCRAEPSAAGYPPLLMARDPKGDRRVAVLLNPAAGHGRARKILPAVERSFEKLGLPFRVVETESMDHAQESAREAVASGEIVAGMGGDGLIGGLAQAVSAGAGTLAIVPIGRGNDFARTLGIPRDTYPACKLIAHGKTRIVDVGDANGRLFLGIAATGMDAVANEIANDATFVRGNLVYAYAGMRALIGWKPARFTLSLDGTEREVVGYSVGVANSKAHGGGMFLAPDADVQDGLFDVVTIADGPKHEIVFAMRKLFDGSHVHLDEVTIERARSVEISADRPFRVYADGEHVADLPVKIEIVPRALKIIAPD